MMLLPMSDASMELAPSAGPKRATGGFARFSMPGLRRAAELISLPLLAVGMIAGTVTTAVHRGDLAIDFRHVTPYIQGLAHGTNPFVEKDVGLGGHFLWTVLAGWILSPFAWLPHGYLIVVALEGAGIVGAALLLGVRDWRIIAITLAWPTTANSVQTGNITVLVLVLLAAAWYDRDRARAGLWAGLAMGVKLFAWPVLVWLAATKRWRAFGLGLAVQLFTLMITLPYISLGSYFRFEREVDHLMAPQALTLDALTRRLGGSSREGTALALAVGLVILWKSCRSLAWVTVSMLVLSPVVWLHYYGLLLIPLALWSPPLIAWCIPLLLVLVPGQGNGTIWQTALALTVLSAVAVMGSALATRRRSAAREA
jgi:hypothetical protein